MTKKNMRLNAKTSKKTQGYIPGGLDSLIKEVSKRDHEENVVRMNFEISEILRNEFKSKVAMEGKKVKDVLATFMQEYVKEIK